MDGIIRKENGTFAPGTVGGPGRPKGKSLKEFWRARFAEMTDEEKLDFSQKVSPEMLFRMAEGNPASEMTGENGGPIVIQVSKEVDNKLNVSPQITEPDRPGQA